MTAGAAGGPDPADVVVVGAGPAGATVAALAAQRGASVLLLEQRSDAPPDWAESLFPGIHPVLAELGLQVAAHVAGWRRNLGEAVGNGPTMVRDSFAELGPFGAGYHVTYRSLQQLLVRRAAELGAVVVDGATVTGPVVAGGAVTGVRYRREGGHAGTAAARLVVDASGRARAVCGSLATGDPPPAPPPDLVLRVRVRGLRLVDPADRHHHLSERVAGVPGWCWLTPLGHDEFEAGRVLRGGDHPSPAEAVRQWGGWPACVSGTGLADRVAGGPAVTDTTVDRWAYHASRPVGGDGWLSVGDAAGVAEPVLAATATLAVLAGQAAAHAALWALGEPPGSVPARYSDAYLRVLDCLREYAVLAFDPDRDLATDPQLAQRLIALANDPATAATMARLRGAMGGAHPLFDVQCPDGPLLASFLELVDAHP